MKPNYYKGKNKRAIPSVHRSTEKYRKNETKKWTQKRKLDRMSKNKTDKGDNYK
jgi:hypothetical protein